MGPEQRYYMIIRDVLDFIGHSITFKNPVIDEEGMKIVRIEKEGSLLSAIDNCEKRWTTDYWSLGLFQKITAELNRLGYVSFH